MATPVEAPEGIRITQNGRYLTGIVSVSEIEILDLISQGPIDGLVNKEYTFQGTEGSIGWDSYTTTTYENPVGTAGYNWLRSIYLNEVPVVDSANKYNYQRVDMSYSNGEPNGSVLNGSNLFELNISRTINERLRASELNDTGSINKDFTKFYRIYNKDCKGTIINVRVTRLSETNPENGDINQTTIDYKIYYRPFYSNSSKSYSLLRPDQGGFFGPIQERIDGKISSAYIRSTKIDFPEGPLQEPDFVGWEIKVFRTTKDSVSVYLQNQTYVDSLTEIYSNTFSYPYSAVIRSRYNAEFFASVPQRAFDTRLLKIKIPKNYDPIKKSYASSGPGTTNGFWNGEFADSVAWTDNPAWCFYDILTNKRYGLGEQISESNVDKFSLYKIAQYCDTLVPDGYGGLEPRFTCNLIMFSREEAYKVLNDLASIFNGMTYYSNGSIYVSQDKPKNPIMFFTNANVENGDFNYSSTSKKTRYSVAIVRYNDPKNFFKPAIEYIQDINGLRKYGVRTTEIAAFGCTSKGQAARLGKWMLTSNLGETETVTYVAGSDASYLRPGDVVGIYDSNRKTYRNSGRLSSITTTSSSAIATLDSTIDLQSGITYYFYLVTPTFNYDGVDISDLDSGDIDNLRRESVQRLEFTSSDVSTNSNNQSVISFTSPLNVADYIVQSNQVWIVCQKDSSNPVDTTSEYNRSIDKNYDYFRIIRITEKENGKYEIAGAQYLESKFDEITQSVAFERPDAVVNALPTVPLDFQLSSHNITSNSKLIQYVITPPSSMTGVTSYKIFVSTSAFDTSVPSLTYLAQTLPSISNPIGNYYPSSNGTYYFRVYSYNDETRTYSTTYIDKNIYISELQLVKDIKITSLTINGSSNSPSVGYLPIDEISTDNISPLFTWQVGLKDGAHIPDNLYYRVTIRERSTNSDVPSQNIYYDKTGVTVPYYKFDFDINSALSYGPYRNYEVVVEAHDSLFNTSAGNIIANGSTPISENGWLNNTEGYDRIYVYNYAPSGVSLGYSSGNMTSFTNIIDSGKAVQYMDFNGGVGILFGKNSVSSGVIGGFIYASTGSFTSTDVITNRADIVVRQFNFNQIERYAYAPAIFSPYLQFQTGWVAVSLYDSFNYQSIAKAPSSYTGLAISNVSPVFATGLAYSLEIKNEIKITNPLNYNDKTRLAMNNVNGTGTTRISFTDGAHGEVIITSKKP